MIMKSSIVILLTINFTCYTNVILYPVPPLQSQRTNNLEWYEWYEKSTPLIEEPLKLQMKVINYVYLYMHTGGIKVDTLIYQKSFACSNNVMGVREKH